MNWYKTLIQPPFTPPVWVFTPAWIVLYFMIFLSLVIYAVKPYGESKSWGYVLFLIQLALNLCWSPVFFYAHNIGMALAIIVIIDILVILTIVEFFRVSKTSALLLVPYLIWIIFATYLNAGFFVLN